MDELVAHHRAIDDVAVADEIRDKRVLRLVVNALWRADLLNPALVHDHDGIRHGEGFLLIVRDEDERDAELALQLDELALHVLPELQVERRQRLIEEQHLGLVHDGARDGNTLLLPARELRHLGVLIAVEVDEFQRIADLVADIAFILALDAQAERDIIRDIHMRKQRILLENRIHLTLLRRHLRDILSLEQDAALIRCLKAADKPQERRLSTAGRSQQGHELILMHRQIQILENHPIPKGFLDMLQFQQFLFHVSTLSSLRNGQPKFHLYSFIITEKPADRNPFGRLSAGKFS